MAIDGRTYTIGFQGVSITAQQDVFAIMPAANKPVRLDSIYLANVAGQAESGDAHEDMWDVEIIRLQPTATLGSGGTTGSPYPVAGLDTFASFVSHVNDTSKATGSPPNVVHSDGMNNRVPYVWMPPPEQRITCTPSSAIVFRLNTTPALGGKFNGTAYVTELG